MRVTIIAVGKLKEKYLVNGCKEYLKRLGRYGNFTVVELTDEPCPANASAAEEEQVRHKEGNKILASLPKDSQVIALDVTGDKTDSPGLARRIENLALRGNSHLTFIIGGSLGLSAKVIDRSHWRLSFSDFTFPHQLMRLILLEQLYRSFKINRGETYHK
ncbi:23S rRNA (pseudouridine(1915)-N(3))-methyltransferase RlmH [Metallumcola ferriviriculae]|uniref:Ribosomal RNA large subunit methyltransferase H n=1 Tax=Metallumcola ferriviriculae TaxID=3039180 RepID=A0AAU0UKJ5_9FIRM|nr:23S rRNA (pseudouridine(1915)-N(3))-methyltransferase RlmH [Desulfitibacteraceae bacterium MK1]